MTLNARILNANTARLPASLMGICLLFAAMVGTATAETRYVSDELQITLRSGQSTQHQILRMIPSGTPLEVLETNEDTQILLMKAMKILSSPPWDRTRASSAAGE